MTGTTLLLTLLGLAYVGSMLMGGRRLRGYGLPSGLEYIALGGLLGPHVLGAVDRSTLAGFEPIIATSAAWLALVAGVQYGRIGQRPISARAMTVGLLFGLVTACSVAACVYAVAVRFTTLDRLESLLTAGGAGIVSCETTRHAGHWLSERYGARGPLHTLLTEVAAADDAVPLLSAAMLFTFAAPETELGWSLWGAAVATVAIGIVLGGVAAVLLRVEIEAGDGWGVLLGAALLATGTAWRFGWSALSALFVMGVSLSLFSRHATELRDMLSRTEQPVLLPSLVLAGALLRIERTPELLLIAAAALVPRSAWRMITGTILGASAGIRSVAPALGVGMLSTGGLTVVIGMVCALRFPGSIGNLVLGVAIVLTAIGELLGPSALRRALLRAGELESTDVRAEPASGSTEIAP